MAVPTITTVSPLIGWTGGQVIKITGTNFNVPVIPAATTGKLPPPLPTVEVKFGAVVGSAVRVISSTSLEVKTPIADAGLVDVTVTNLDSSGVAIPGETVTNVDAFTYALPLLTDQPCFDRINMQLLIELKRQVFDNVSMGTHIDFDDDIGGSLDVTALAKLPALVVSGPDISYADGEYRSNSPLEITIDSDTFEEHRAPLTVNLEYQINVIAEYNSQLISLQTLVLQFFERNTKLIVIRDPADLSKGTIDFEMAWEIGTTFRNVSKPNDDNIKSYVGNILIRGVIIENIAGFTSETLDKTNQVVDGVVIEGAIKL